MQHAKSDYRLCLSSTHYVCLIGNLKNSESIEMDSHSGSSLEIGDLIAGGPVIGIQLYSECKRIAQINIETQLFFFSLTFKSGSSGHKFRF